MNFIQAVVKSKKEGKYNIYRMAGTLKKFIYIGCDNIVYIKYENGSGLDRPTIKDVEAYYCSD